MLYRVCAVHAEDVKRRILAERQRRKKQHNRTTDARSLCQICGKDIMKSAMRGHVKRHKSAESPRCDVADCSSLFATLEEKRKHMNSVHKKLRGPCDQCGSFFKSLASLREHGKVVHEKKSLDVKCTVCDMIFTHRQNMQRHRTLVHYPDKFRCKICQRSFSCNMQLRRHGLVHTDERNFACDECDRKFKRRRDLDDHKMVHAGVKSFGCPYCSYTGTTKELLYHHKRNRHREEFDEESFNRQKVDKMLPRRRFM